MSWINKKSSEDNLPDDLDDEGDIIEDKSSSSDEEQDQDSSGVIMALNGK